MPLQKKIWKVIEELCRKLAEAENNDEYLIEDAITALDKTLGVAETIPFEKFIDQEASGLDELNKLLLRFENDPYDFQVFQNWSFRDSMGTITNCGLMYEGLLSSALSGDFPSGPSIGQLLADDKPIRFY